MKKTVAIFFTFLILASNANITMASHSCFGRIVKSAIQLGKKDISCGMLRIKKACDAAEEQLQKKSCCESNYLTLKTDSVETTLVKTTLHPVFFLAFTCSFIAPQFIEEPQNNFSHYSPPLLQKDITILHQVFRI